MRVYWSCYNIMFTMAKNEDVIWLSELGPIAKEAALAQCVRIGYDAGWTISLRAND